MGAFYKVEQREEEYGVDIGVMMYDSRKSCIPKETKTKRNYSINDAILPGDPINVMNDNEIDYQFVTKKNMYCFFIQNVNSDPSILQHGKGISKKQI